MKTLAKGVFLHRADSIYDDRPDEWYQFPSQYFSRANQFVGDWIVYYEPVKAGKKGYFAIARVEKIVSDPTISGMYLAIIEPGSYLPMEYPVPFNDLDGLVERGLLNEAGKISGRAQAAVRPISLEDFNRILERGIPDVGDVLPRVTAPHTEAVESQFHETASPFIFDQERQRISSVSNRVVRDRVFRKIVLDAYDCRCAMTGFKFINGGGRAEVEAAHIKPVEANGPDIIANGIALSGTVHWMFDRGLVSLSDDLDILVSRQVNDSERIWSLVNSNRKATLPHHPTSLPHPRFLEWHRQNCFKH
jgi:putative restriction endonuclease